jgi:hypothetical protein
MLKFLFAVLAIFFSSSAFAQASLIIKSTAILDGNGAIRQGPVDIEIAGNKIVRIGHDLASKASRVIDGRGKTVIPGLIDTHTHLHSVPGSVFRGESLEEIRRQQAFQLKAYLAAGVTTVLDTAAPESLFREVAKAGFIGPRVLGLAPFLTPKNGYFAGFKSRGTTYSDLWNPIHELAAIKGQFDRAALFRPLGAKVTI